LLFDARLACAIALGHDELALLHSRLRTVTLALLVLFFSSVAHAEITPEVGGGIVIDFNAGGQDMLVLGFSDGSEQKITGGQGVAALLSVGAIFFDQQSHNLETILSGGIKYSTMQESENASLDFFRFPIEGLAFYRNDDWFFRVGGGAQLLLGASMKGSGVLEELDVKFKPAIGGIGQLDFIYKGWSAGVRYTRQGLAPKDSDTRIASHSVGLQIAGMFQFRKRK